MRIQFKSGLSSSSESHRWLVSVVNASLEAYSASVEFYNSFYPSSTDSVEAPLTSGTLYLQSYQFVTKGDDFSVVFRTKLLPEAHSTGLVLLAEPFSKCPKGWLDTGISCYGLPSLAESTLVSKADSEVACGRLGGGWLSQGVYDNDHIDKSISNLLSLRGGDSDFGSQSSHKYWVGIINTAPLRSVEMNRPHVDFKYANYYKVPHPIERDSSCSEGEGTCNCVIYNSGRFLSDQCSAKHRFICVMPLKKLFFCIPSAQCQGPIAKPVSVGSDSDNWCQNFVKALIALSVVGGLILIIGAAFGIYKLRKNC